MKNIYLYARWSIEKGILTFLMSIVLDVILPEIHNYLEQ